MAVSLAASLPSSVCTACTQVPSTSILPSCHPGHCGIMGLGGMQYHNIFALVRELGIPWPFTDWETSGFWSPEKGLTIEAPVFSKLPRLPTMLGQFVHTLPLFRCAFQGQGALRRMPVRGGGCRTCHKPSL